MEKRCRPFSISFSPSRWLTLLPVCLYDSKYNSRVFYISIVGIEHFPGLAYYAAKLEAERIIEARGIPYTILRTTQFHELLDQVFLPPLFKLPFIALVPTDLKFQVVDSGEVAARMADLVPQGPQARVPDMGGPKVYSMGELAQTWAAAQGIGKSILPLPFPGATGRAFRAGKNTTPDCSGQITWEHHLALKYGKEKVTNNKVTGKLPSTS